MSNQVPPHLRQETAPAGNQTTATGGSFEQQVIELKRRMKELDKREQSLNGAMTREQIAAEIKKDKASFLKGFGVDLPESQDDVPDHIREFRELKAQIEKDKADNEKQKYRDSVLSKVTSDKDKYELLNLLGNEDELFGELDRRRASGDEFDETEVFDSYENNLYQTLEKAKSSKKLASWFEPKAPAPPSQVKPGYQNHPLDANRTMTSNDRGSSSSSESVSERPLSRAESLARVAAKYGNNNNPQGN